MTVVVSTLFCSLDGVAEIDPAWHFPYFDDAMGAAVGEDYADTDVLLLGRVTYDSFAGAWPDRETAGGPDSGFAKDLGDMRKVVATRGDSDLGWRNTQPTSDPLGTVRSLREESGVEKVLVAGSLSIVRQLLSAGELDELRLLVHPVAADTGERIFDGSVGLQPLELKRADVLPTGVLRLIYSPSELPGTAAYDDVTEHVPQA